MTRITDFLKGVLSLALIVALLVGIPVLLLTIVGFPLPTEVPSLRLIGNHIEDGIIPDLFVVKTLALVVWVVWVQLAVAVLAEVFGLLRGRASGRAPVLPGIQLFAAKLVASTVLIVSALSPTRAVTAAPILPLDAALASADDLSSGGPMQLTQLDDLGAIRLSPSTPGPDHSPVATSGTSARYLANYYATRRGDNWWDIAERLLGDGMRWSELRRLNTGKTTLTGEIITDQTETVGAGWHLDVPADADPALLTQSIPIVDPAGVDDRSGAVASGRAHNGALDRRAPDGALRAERTTALSIAEHPMAPPPATPWAVCSMRSGPRCWFTRGQPAQPAASRALPTRSSRATTCGTSPNGTSAMPSAGRRSSRTPPICSRPSVAGSPTRT